MFALDSEMLDIVNSKLVINNFELKGLKNGLWVAREKKENEFLYYNEHCLFNKNVIVRTKRDFLGSDRLIILYYYNASDEVVAFVLIKVD
jgi:hypothetical protein